MSLGFWIFASTVLILAWVDKEFRKAVLWVLGVGLIVLILLVVFAARK